MTLTGNHKKTLLKFTFSILLAFCYTFSFAQLAANFSASPVSGCAPLTVTFQDLSSGSPTGWQWDLGNGTISTQQSPTTTYFNAGNYTITLTISDINGNDSIKKNQYITVYDKPTANFSISSTTGCFPLRAGFTDLSSSGSGTITNWDWDFGDGNSDTLQNAYHKYASTGNYAVALKVTNSNGCSNILIKPALVKVTNGVKPGFINSTPVHCKAPETISFTNTSTGPGTLTYQWNFGDGNTSTVQNPSNSYLTSDTFSVQLIVKSSSGCTDTLLKTDSLIIRNYQTKLSGPDSVCINTAANFNNISQPLPTTSFWNFGDGDTSSSFNPSKTWITAGVFTIKLKNDYGVCTDSISKPIKVTSSPVVKFSVADTIGCVAPFSTQFVDSSSGAVSWFWDFGDGKTSTQKNPLHTFDSLKSYTVSLTVTNAAGCTTTLKKTNYIKLSRLSPAIFFSNPQGCLSTYAVALSAGLSYPKPVNYLWDFGDGTTSTLTPVSKKYLATGTYTVKLYVTTADGCSDSAVKSNLIKIGTPVAVNFSAAPLVQCVGKNVQFTDSTIGADSWIWDFGDGTTSTLKNPIHAYQLNGTFTVKLTAGNNGCQTLVTKTNYIQVLPPVAKFTPVVDCSNKTSVSFTDNSIQPQTWNWKFGDSDSITTQNAIHNYAALGSYNVVLTVTNGGCVNSKTIAIKLVNEHADFSKAKDSVCKNTAATFSVINSTAANITNYTFDFGDGTIVSTAARTLSHTYVTPGTYSVKLTITDINSCKDSITKVNYITIVGPTAKFTAMPMAGCKGVKINFTDNSLTDGNHLINKWQWNYGDGIIDSISTPPFNHIYNTTGSFPVNLKIKDSNGCTDSISSATPIIVTMPKAAFTSKDTLSCIGNIITLTNTSTGVTPTYAWTFGDGNSATQPAPTLSYAADGNYSVKLIVTDVNGCKDSLSRSNFIKIKTSKAAFTVSDSVSSCSPFQVNFTNTSLNSTLQNWDFGDGTTSTSSSPVHYYSTPGVYTVTLYAKGQGTCIDSIKRTIRLYPSTAVLKYSPLQSCSQISVNLHATTAGPVSYFWDFGDGNTLQSNDSIINKPYSFAGSYVPKVILTDPTGCQIPLIGTDTIKITKSNVNFGVSDSLVCFGQPITFTDSTIGNVPIKSYKWTFGDGATSSQQKPVHSYSSAGNYSISLVVTTTDNCNDTLLKSNFIHVYGPTAKFTVSSLKGCQQNSIINFTDNSTTDSIHAIVNWHWDYGDGIIKDLSSLPFTHIYDTSGSFVPKLKITDSYGCSDSFMLNVPIIVTNPKAAFVASDTLVCSSSTVIFNNNSTGSSLTYAWSLGDGNISIQKNPSISYADGVYTVKLVVTDNNGCTDSLQKNNYITVQTAKALFILDDSVTSCPPLNVHFTNNSINDTAVIWSFGDGATSTTNNPVHTFSTPGKYIITLIAKGPGGCADSAKSTVEIFSPLVSVTYSPLISCSGLTATFHASSSGPMDSYSWNFGDGDTAISISPDTTHDYITPGNYLPKLIANDPSGCKIAANNTDSIHIIKSFVAFKAIDSSVCFGNAITFADNTSSTGIIASYHWDFGDGDTSSLPNPVHAYAATGAYTINLKVTTTNGCIDSLVKNNYIHVYGPKAKFGVSANAGCQPLSVNFLDSSGTDGINTITNWQWNYGDSIIENLIIPPFTHIYNFGSFIPSLKVTDAFGCSDSITLANQIFVTNPKAVFYASDSLICSSTSITFNNISTGNNLTYAWSLGSGASSAQSPTTTYPTDGIYSVKLVVTDINGCKDSLQKDNYITVRTVKAAFTLNDSLTSCAPLNVQFTNSSVNDTGFVWHFGDGSTSTVQNPSHSFTDSGTFVVTLVAQGPGGCVDSAKHTVKVFSPKVSLAYSPLNSCSGLNATFHITSTGPIVSYTWDFGDGDTATTTTIDTTHNYSTPGNYLPKVFANDISGCKIPAIGTDSIHITKSNVSFFTSDSAACLASAVHFSDATTSTGNIISYHWDFGDGTASVQQNPIHTYASTGTYSIKLTVTTIEGCIDSLSKTNYVHVYGPKAKFGVSATKGCQPLSINFLDSSTTDGINSITNWQWNYGDGTIENLTTLPFAHVYNFGSFTPSLKVTDTFGCSDSITLNNQIFITNPKAGFYASDSLACSSTQVTFNNVSSGNNLTYAWSLGSGTSSAQNPTTTYPADGTYSVKLVITDINGCKDSLQKDNYINVQTAKASFTLDDSATSCPPLNVQFTNTSINANSIQWNFGDGATSTNANPTHSYSTSGTYIVTLITNGAGGCIDSSKHTVQIFSPNISLSYSPLNSCSTLNATFHATSTGPITSYTWNFGDGDTAASVNPDITHLYSTPGVYLPKITAHDISGCSIPVTGSDSIHITKSNVNFTANDTVVCSGEAIGFTNAVTSTSSIASYQWNFGDGTISSQPNPTHKYISAGIYSVKLVVTTINGCADSITKNNYIKVNTVPDISITKPVSGCVQVPVTFNGVWNNADTSTIHWSWTFGNGNTSALQNPVTQLYNTAGNFPVLLIAQSLSGCADTSSTSISINGSPVVDAGSNVNICSGAQAQLNAIGAISYTWSPATNLSCTNCANPVATPANDITYYVKGVAANGCENTDSVSIKINGRFTLTVTPKTDSLCFGQSTQLTASGGGKYIWSPAYKLSNPGINNPVATPDSSITYKVVATDNNNCYKDSATVKISVFAYPVVNAGPDKRVFLGEPVTLSPFYSTDINSWTWTPSTDLSCSSCPNPTASVQKSTTYTVKVMNAAGCTAQDEIKIILPCEGSIFIPNTFSPNGDKVNDVFYPRGTDVYMIQSLRVFDRWGELVFQRTNFAPNVESLGWDGRINGTTASSDVYTYIIEIICNNNNISTFKGNVSLIR
ncbi:PKD domain-containing protein [Ferruginibacter albus]|uniref:PKD domain-containing protein n=1 Tax=Ferruginibacter albus TaxID=2875540 RepID=UPI0028F446B3|nr:PKD domain-containing protein [Ferruginibacter albus]UAY51015.1 PKD domain-containing protein [Ferruginibacter albus]